MLLGALLLVVLAWQFTTNPALLGFLGMGNVTPINYDAIMRAERSVTQSSVTPGATAARTPTRTSPVPTGTQIPSTTRVLAVQRIGQVDVEGQNIWRSQYDSDYPYDTWAFSTCSTASMTEVMDFYGQHLRIADVLRVEAGLRDNQRKPLFTWQDGTLDNSVFDRTVVKFGFKARWLPAPSNMDQLKGAALTSALWSAWSGVRREVNDGHPVIVNFPPDTFAGGHFLLVVGASRTSVYLVDSSRRNNGQGWKQLTFDAFFTYWRGLAVVITPN